MPVNAGMMRDKVTILKLTEVQDDYGAIKKEVVEIGTYYCRAQNISNSVIGSNIRQAQNVLKITVRYKPSLETPASDMYVRFRGIDYDIESVINPKMMNESLIIECTLKGE